MTFRQWLKGKISAAGDGELELHYVKKNVVAPPPTHPVKFRGIGWTRKSGAATKKQQKAAKVSQKQHSKWLRKGKKSASQKRRKAAKASRRRNRR
uniref:Uncharacterized protein n=2 Tax=viral metagenome TaxID=1070528 RepID=A0A6M3L029_9ZZZZ